MVKRIVLASIVGILFGAAAAAQTEHAIAPETDLVPVVTQEICTTIDWGIDGVRTNCRMAERPAPTENPALKGICTTYYGRRTCY